MITMILPDTLGGVYYNSLNLASLLERLGYEVSFILTRQLDKANGHSAADRPACPTTNFFFSSTDNKHHLFRKLAARIPANSEVLILNDWLDYKLVAHRRLSQKVIAILHGDYPFYYELARASENRIDQFIGISATITAKLTALLPHREKDIVFIPPVVPDPKGEAQKNSSSVLRIVFVGRLTRDKGFDQLPLVDEALVRSGIPCSWTIIAPHTTAAYDGWLHSQRVSYLDYVPNSEMSGVYGKQDIILLPSHAEGFPLTLLEAMKTGAVPLATKLETLLALIDHGRTGFLFPADDTDTIVQQITRLHVDRELLHRTGEAARALSLAAYGEATSAQDWTSLLKRPDSGKDLSGPVTLIYDRLDLPWIPNPAARVIRKLNRKKT